MKAVSCLLAMIAPTDAQLMPPGTTDVPMPRAGDCDQKGPATYHYRLSEKDPNDFFPNVCPEMGGAEVHFNDPCAWAHGQAQMTTAHFTKMCKGATRTIHWHNQADEWGYVNKGQLYTFLASPDGLPWPSSHNVLDPKGVWYFPAGWLHGLMCMTPEEDGGCEFTIVFASPQAAEPNGHNLDTTMAQAPTEIAAAALHVSEETYSASRAAFAKSEHSIHYSNSNMTAPIVTPVAPGVCDPQCPAVAETVAVPAAVQNSVEQKVLLPGANGVTLYRIRQDQFPFARTMSQERTELAPGAFRPLVWTTADAALVVIEGNITFGLQGGIPGNEAHKSYVANNLVAGDVQYVPNARAFWFKEATGTKRAETIMVFNVGNWKSIEMGSAIKEMPHVAVMSNLNLTQWAKPGAAVEL